MQNRQENICVQNDAILSSNGTGTIELKNILSVEAIRLMQLSVIVEQTYHRLFRLLINQV